MNQHDANFPSTLDAFLAQFEKDKAAGRVRSVQEYMDMFPGADDEIASVHVRLKESGDPVHFSFDSRGQNQLGPYQVECELGRGGQGEVYLAEDTRLKRKVALKVLRHLGPGSENILLRFKREAEVAAKLDHPGICAILDAGVISGTPYIAMQYVEGQSLSHKISTARESEAPDLSTFMTLESETDQSASGAREPTSTDSGAHRSRTDLMRVVEIVEKAARALHAAHEAGVLHRDIKPGNVMVTPNGEPVILDFGLARDEDSDVPTLTQTGDLMGTPAYMSPEQLARHSIRLDRRTDIWSLGVMLYECLALKRPFEAPTREGIYHAIMTKDPPDLRKLNSSVPDDLRTVLERTLEKDRDRRYETALDLAEELRRAREYEPIHASPITRWIKVKRWAQRNPPLAGSLAAGGLAVIIGLALTTWQWRRAEANLARYDQMSDAALVQDLMTGAAKLWPRRPHMLPAISRWLDEARRLHGRLPLHEAALQELRDQATPYDGAQQAADAKKRQEAHAEALDLIVTMRHEIADSEKALTELRSRIDEIDSSIEKEGDKSLIARSRKHREDLDIWSEEVRASIAAARLELETLKRTSDAEQRLTWQLHDPVDRWRNEVLSLMVRELRTFSSLITDVEERQRIATTIERRSIADHRDAWDRCLADLKTNPHYASSAALRTLEPQIGLVPLGIDRDSGCWEFAHLESGRRPNWDGADWRAEEDADLRGRVRITEASGVVLVLLPAGSFWIGARRDAAARNHDPEADNDERPEHRVSLDAFFMSKNELTQAQWQRLMGKNPSRPRIGSSDMRGGLVTGLHPASNIDWQQGREAMQRWALNLPTEAQWEYACRARTSTIFWCGDSEVSIQDQRAGNIADQTASRNTRWSCTPDVDDGHIIHAPIASFRANAFGLHDVLGNVWEWCEDRYASYDQPTRPGDGLRVVAGSRDPVRRGGSFYFPAFYSRSAYRNHPSASFRRFDLGLRPARNISGPR